MCKPYVSFFKFTVRSWSLRTNVKLFYNCLGRGRYNTRFPIIVISVLCLYYKSKIYIYILYSIDKNVNFLIAVHSEACYFRLVCLYTILSSRRVYLIGF